MIYGYQSAKDFFVAVQEASTDYKKTKRELDYLLVQAQGIAHKNAEIAEIKTQGSGSPLPALIDKKQRLEQRLAEDYELIDKANTLIYADGGGLVELLGDSYASALWWRYVSALSVKNCADILSYSERQIYRMSAAALDLIDAYGVENVIAGVGGA